MMEAPVTEVAVKAKRGRKPKAAGVVPVVKGQVTTDGAGADAASVPDKKTRGRKPRQVFAGEQSTGGIAASVTADNVEDEHIVLKLKVQHDIDDHNILAPDAYNCHDINYLGQPFQDDNDASVCLGDDDDTASMTLDNATTFPTSSNALNGLQVVRLLKDFEEKSKHNEWPMSTTIHCYWCCHGFDTVPCGIPTKYMDGKYYVLGCFCSLECAAAHNFSTKEGTDEMWERFSLLNMLSRTLGYRDFVKPAPARLALKMFGGHMDIDEFRSYTCTNKTINVNFPPMMTMTQQIEEIHESDLNNDFKYIPIDTERINRYKEKIKLKRQHPVTNFKNTLDHSMKLKYGAAGAVSSPRQQTLIAN